MDDDGFSSFRAHLCACEVLSRSLGFDCKFRLAGLILLLQIILLFLHLMHSVVKKLPCDYISRTQQRTPS